MKIIVSPETSFGVITEFDSFDLNFVQRKDFVQISDLYKLSETDIPKQGGFANSTTESVPLSPLFEDENFLNFTINPFEDSTRGRHCYNNNIVYNNLQRLCYEVLEPLVDFIGERPTINSGVLFSTRVNVVEEDTFIGDQLRGNGVILSFPNDGSNQKIIDSFNFISEFCLFDRLIYDNTLNQYSVPTIRVSVSDKKRKMKLKVRG